MGITDCINKCSKEEKDDVPGNPQYFIEETPSSFPQSIIDLKVNTGNFIVQREGSKGEKREKSASKDPNETMFLNMTDESKIFSETDKIITKLLSDKS